MELYHVGLPRQAQCEGADRYGKFGPDPPSGFMGLDMRPIVHNPTFGGEPVSRPFPLHVCESALPLTEQDVLKPESGSRSDSVYIIWREIYQLISFSKSNTQLNITLKTKSYHKRGDHARYR